MKKLSTSLTLFFSIVFFIPLIPYSKAQGSRGPSSVNLNEIRQNVKVSNKSFRKLTRIQLGSSIQILDYRYWDTVPGGLRRAYQFRDQLHGVYMEALCGSYEETKRMAIKQNIKNLLTEWLTDNLVAPYQLICECRDGRVLIYSSPYRINFWDAIDPDWDSDG